MLGWFSARCGAPSIHRLKVSTVDPTLLSIKFFGYRLAQELAKNLPVAISGDVIVGLNSKLATQADVESQWFSHWMAELKLPVVYNRKLWEFAYVLQAIHEAGLLGPGCRAVGFGCGQEPIASYLASRGVEVVVTDLNDDDSRAKGWVLSTEHAGSLHAAFKPDLVSEEDFNRLESHRFVDMTDIPSDLRDFDFCWSVCALEHLGTIKAGLDFAQAAMLVLSPGGLAVHTTEFNCLHAETIETGPTVFFRRDHIQKLLQLFSIKGHTMAPCDFELGCGPIDQTIDIPPYPSQLPDHASWIAPAFMPHLKLISDGLVATCFGFHVKKGKTMENYQPSDEIKGLKSLVYNEDYYEEHKNAGLDYLGHGYWQQSYAAMIADVTLQGTYENPVFFDGGCACGSILTGFKKTGVFKRVVGLDLSDHMVNLGRKHFGLSDSEIIAGSLTSIPLEANSISLIHSAQVLEHIPDDLTDCILDEFARILQPGGRAFLCLDAVRHGEAKEMYMGDPTHFNIQPVLYWTKKLQDRGLLFDIEAYNRFVKSDRGPTQGNPSSFFQHYPYWSAWTLIKI